MFKCLKKIAFAKTVWFVVFFLFVGEISKKRIRGKFEILNFKFEEIANDAK